MKRLFIFLLFPVFCHAQKSGDNAVVAHGVAFDSAVYKLLDMGYHIAEINEHFKTATTKNRGILGMRIEIRVTPAGDLIIQSGVEQSTYIQLTEYTGKDGGRSWKEMMKYADQFGNLEFRQIP